MVVMMRFDQEPRLDRARLVDQGAEVDELQAVAEELAGGLGGDDLLALQGRAQEQRVEQWAGDARDQHQHHADGAAAQHLAGAEVARQYAVGDGPHDEGREAEQEQRHGAVGIFHSM